MLSHEFLVHDDYVLEQEASDYVNAVQINDDLIDKYSLQEDLHQPQHEDYYEDEVAVEETPREEVVHEPRAAPPPEEPVGEKSKMSYASIVSTHPLYNFFFLGIFQHTKQYILFCLKVVTHADSF